MARRVCRVHLVQRHHQAAAEVAIPQAIHHRLGKEHALVRLQGGLDQLGAGADGRQGRGLLRLLGGADAFLGLLLILAVWFAHVGDIELFPGQEHHRGDFLGPLVWEVLHDAGVILGEDAAVLEGAGEERLHAVKVVLRPVAHVRMIVALRS